MGSQGGMGDRLFADLHARVGIHTLAKGVYRRYTHVAYPTGGWTTAGVRAVRPPSMRTTEPEM